MDESATLLAIITSIVALVGTTLTAVFGFRSKTLDAADDVATGFQKFTVELRSEISTLKQEVGILRMELNEEREVRKELERGIRILIQQLRDNNIAPLWVIDRISED